MRTILQLEFHVLLGVGLDTCVSGTVPPAGPGPAVFLGVPWFWVKTGGTGGHPGVGWGGGCPWGGGARAIVAEPWAPFPGAGTLPPPHAACRRLGSALLRLSFPLPLKEKIFIFFN